MRMESSPTLFGTSSRDLIRARQMAKRRRAETACSRCKAGKTKCSDYRPCKRCTLAGAESKCSRPMVLESTRSAETASIDSDTVAEFKNQQITFSLSFGTVASELVARPERYMHGPSLEALQSTSGNYLLTALERAASKLIIFFTGANVNLLPATRQDPRMQAPRNQDFEYHRSGEDAAFTTLLPTNLFATTAGSAQLHSLPRLHSLFPTHSEQPRLPGASHDTFFPHESRSSLQLVLQNHSALEQQLYLAQLLYRHLQHN